MARQNLVDGLGSVLGAMAAFQGSVGGTVAIYDHRPLMEGVGQAAIVLHDRGQSARLASGLTRWDWDIPVELWVRHVDGDVVKARRDAAGYAGSIIQAVLDNRTLGGSAFDCQVIQDELTDEAAAFGVGTFLMETLTVRASEILSG